MAVGAAAESKGPEFIIPSMLPPRFRKASALAQSNAPGQHSEVEQLAARSREFGRGHGFESLLRDTVVEAIPG